VYDPRIAQADEIVIPVQVNGKLRSRLTASPLASEAELERLALADSLVQAHIAGKTIKKVVVIKSRLVNVVAA
jgi:leucyl-tRNA synthetase